jgi:hypothetical protein
MFVADRFIYVQMQKTGCTHIAMLMSKICSGTQIGKHNRPPPGLRESGRYIIGSVRNPWDWYASLWAYGCSRQGALFERLVLDPPGDGTCEAAAWDRSYACADKPELFRLWLHRMHDPTRRHELGERYGESPMSLFCGFFTYRYAYLYSKQLERLYSSDVGANVQLKALLEDDVLDFTIRNEQLEDDLVTALRQCGVPLNEERIQLIYSAPRTNESPGRRTSAFYYDHDTIELVRARDAVLIEKYGYAPPDLRAGPQVPRLPGLKPR